MTPASEASPPGLREAAQRVVDATNKWGKNSELSPSEGMLNAIFDLDAALQVSRVPAPTPPSGPGLDLTRIKSGLANLKPKDFGNAIIIDLRACVEEIERLRATPQGPSGEAQAAAPAPLPSVEVGPEIAARDEGDYIAPAPAPRIGAVEISMVTGVDLDEVKAILAKEAGGEAQAHHLNLDPETAAIVKKQFAAAKGTQMLECPCGRSIPIRFMHKCLYCKVWYCESCAEDHFGKTRAEYHAAKAASTPGMDDLETLAVSIENQIWTIRHASGAESLIRAAENLEIIVKSLRSLGTK